MRYPCRTATVFWFVRKGEHTALLQSQPVAIKERFQRKGGDVNFKNGLVSATLVSRAVPAVLAH